MKIVKKPNGYYYALFKGESGRQKEVSTRSKNKARAELVVKESNLEALELAAQAQVLTADVITRIVAGKKVTLSAALKKWLERMSLRSRSQKTIHNSKTTVAKWLKQCKLETRPPAFVNLGHVSNYINSYFAGNKASTRATTLSAIKTFLEFCADEGWRVGNPASAVSVSKEKMNHSQKEPRPIKLFRLRNVEALIAATSSEFWKFATRCSYETGLRLGDICCMEWDCIKDKSITVWTDKRDQRVGPFAMSGVLLEILKSVPTTSARYLFPKHRAKYVSPTRRAGLSVQFRKLCDDVGLEGYTFHGLRHTYATYAYKEEKISLIQKLQEELAELQVARHLGHCTTKTTKGYIHKS